MCISRAYTLAPASPPWPAGGLKGLKDVCSAVNIPVVAIGGINLKNADEVMKAGAATFCAISASVGSKDVGAAVRLLEGIIGQTPASARST